MKHMNLPMYGLPALTGTILFVTLAVSLFFSRDIPELLLIFLTGYTIFIWFVIRTRSIPLFFLISVLTALTLSLRIPYLPWGDPWQDYAMTIRTLSIGYPDFWIQHEPVLQSLIAQPLMPAFLASLTSLSGQDPMHLQKILVPILGATAPILLFWFVKGDIPKNGAFIGSILFLISTPFIHWLTQPVRETLAIPILLIALWKGYEWVSSGKMTPLIPAIVAILILSPLHTLSSLIFLISWYGISLGYLFTRVPDLTRKEIAVSWSIFSCSFLYSTIWVASFNAPYMNVIISQVSSILSIPHLSPLSLIPGMLIFLSIPFLIFFIQTGSSFSLSALMQIPPIHIRRGVYLLQCFGVIALLIGVYFVSGHSAFKLSYPVPMLIPSMIIFALALLGLPGIFHKKTFFIISWLGTLGTFFIIGVIKPSLVEDPLRTLGYLFAPLCLIAGIGISALSSALSPHKGLSQAGQIILPLFCMGALIVTFPAPVFLGFTPGPDHMLYDERQFTIAHSTDEIEGIRWLNSNHQNGTIYTDTTIYYATLWITQDGKIHAEKHPDRLNPKQFKEGETSYILISDRMFTVAKFGGWLYEKPTPVSAAEYQEVAKNSTLIFQKGDFQIFQAPKIVS